MSQKIHGDVKALTDKTVRIMQYLFSKLKNAIFIKIFPQLQEWVFTFNLVDKTGQSELNLSIYMYQK